MKVVDGLTVDDAVNVMQVRSYLLHMSPTCDRQAILAAGVAQSPTWALSICVFQHSVCLDICRRLI